MKIILLFGCILPLLIFGQDNFKNDLPFFQEKALEYQKWLETKGLGAVLRVDKVKFRAEKDGQVNYNELELLLLVNSFDQDTAAFMWERLKKDFDTPSDSLETFLFRIFVHKMEIPADQGNIQIYVKDQEGVSPSSFYIWIWQEENQIVSEQKLGFKSKSKKFELTIQPFKPAASGQSKSSKITKSKINTAHLVFDNIFYHIKKTILEHPKYQTELTDRTPRIENDSIRTATTLKFTIANMGKEVLTDQTRFFWERWVHINTIAMERLTFSFEYSSLENGAFNLKCTMDGKYGSGLFKPRVSGYMNMETDFDDFFEQYKNNFSLSLRKYLEGMP